MRFVTDRILDLTNVVADTASEALDVDTILHLSVQISWTSTTAAGTIKLQVSNDGLTWIDTTETATVNNNSSAVMFKIIDCPFKFARVAVDWTSGSITTISAVYQGKGF